MSATAQEIKALIDDNLDEAFVASTLVELVQCPSDVPYGQIALQPDDPKLTHYMQDVVRPHFEGLGVEAIRVDALNNLVAQVGKGEQPASLFMVGYSVSQHANRMEDPYSGRLASARALGWDEPCVFGKGASQNKGALAALLGAVKLIRDAGVGLEGRLVLAVNSEGESSHRCMEQIIQAHRVSADGGVLCIGTGNRITLGNRGRVDVYITVEGKTAHSSQPWLGINAIEGLAEVLQRLRQVQLHGKHPSLGKTQLTVYNVRCTPSSPHTIPDRCRIIIDRRILPGEEIETAVEEIRQAVATLETGTALVESGAYMYPALVEPDFPVVQHLARGHELFTGRPADCFYPDYTFDAGYPCRVGIPTVMCGPASWADVTLGEEIVQTEFVALSQVFTATRIYAYTILNYLT